MKTFIHPCTVLCTREPTTPAFQCTRCGRKTRQEYEVSCTGDPKRNVEKPPECCGKPMIETID